MRKRPLIILIASLAVVGLLAAVGTVVAVTWAARGLVDASPPDRSSVAWKGATYAEPIRYDVRGGALLEQENGAAADRELADAWSQWTTIMGERESEVRSVAVSDDSNESTMASVARDSDDPRIWDAELNMAWATDSAELRRTMVHEYGHIYSLSAEDVAVVEGACPTFEFSEGCLAERSILGRFLARFWADDPAGAEAEAATEEDADRRYESEGGADAFVSEYAATNGAEDFAETFATFVLSDGSPGGSAGSVVSAKLDFLAGDQATAAERTRIRSALGLE